jgi:hypothetical protein
MAVRLFVSSYAGTITPLELSKKSTAYSLDVVAISRECTPNPSWITLDRGGSVLYCTELGVRTENGTLNTLSIQNDGSLRKVDSIPTLIGAAFAGIYGHEQAMCIAF